MQWSRGRKTPARLVLRAKIVLAAAAGQENKDIAAELECTRRTAGTRRSRFAEDRLAALMKDAPRSGRAPSARADKEAEFIRKTTQETPPNAMVTDDPNHPGGGLLMNTGERVFTRPSIRAWVTYGLGTENQNLPGFVAIGPGPIIEGARQYGASFLPAAFQGTFVSNLAQPLRNLSSLQVPRARHRHRSTDRRFTARFEISRPARRNAGGLGRRIRSHANR